MKCDISTQTIESSFEQVKQVQQPTPVNTSIVTDWLKANASILFIYRYQFKDTRYIYAQESDVNKSFRAYKRMIKDKSVKSVKDTLVALGFKYVKTSVNVGHDVIKGVRMYRIEKDKYNDVISHL